MNPVEIALGIVATCFMAAVVWHSTLIISERKARFRAGTHDYYDNPIVKNKDETIS